MHKENFLAFFTSSDKKKILKKFKFSRQNKSQVFDFLVVPTGAKRTAEESHHSGNSPSNKKARGDDDFYGLGEGPEVTLRFLIQSVVSIGGQMYRNGGLTGYLY